MKKILEIMSSKKAIVIQLIVQSIVGATLGLTIIELIKVTNGYGILDFSFGYSLEQIKSTFHAYGDKGMSLYMRVQLLDLVNPLLYSFLLASAIYIFYKNLILACLPFFVGLLDYSENILLFKMAVSSPNISESMAQLSNAVSIVKHVSLIVVILVFVFGVFRYFRTKGIHA